MKTAKCATLVVGAIALMSLAICTAKEDKVKSVRRRRVSKIVSKAPTASTKQTIVSVDSLYILRESAEGKKLETEVKKEVAEFEAFVRRENSELMSQKESLMKQASVLSKDALQEKQSELQSAQRTAQRKIEDRREELARNIQSRQIKLRDSQVTVANEVRQKAGWTLMLEKNNPFVLGVAEAIDKTSDVLKEVNTRYQAKMAQHSKEASSATATT
jgi:Skp family chaperone for outer membrane proteins